jgi:hypothetical protein
MKRYSPSHALALAALASAGVLRYSRSSVGCDVKMASDPATFTHMEQEDWRKWNWLAEVEEAARVFGALERLLHWDRRGP